MDKICASVNPFSFTCLEINSLTRDNVERVCAYAKRFNIGTIGYMSAEWQRFQFLDHTEWGVPPVDDNARRFMEDYQNTIREASERVVGNGLDFYLWRRDLRLPVGFVEKYGVDWINFENPELWDLWRWNTEQIFKLFPATKGIFLSCTGEQKAGEWITANGVGGRLPLWQRYEKTFRLVKETCDRLGRRVVFRNHGAGNQAIPLVYNENTEMWHFLKAAAAAGKDVTLMAKGVEPDYQATYPFNSILAPMAQQQDTYMELSLPMEYNAVGRTPFPMVEDIKMRLLKALEIGCKGAVARIDWHMTGHRTVDTWSCLDTFNEINSYAFCRLINEPGLPAGEIHSDFARERFGARAEKTAVFIFKDLYEAGCKNYYELGVKGCRTPSGAPNTPDGIVVSQRKDHIFRWSFSPTDFANRIRGLEPDRRFLKRIESEKNEALEIYRSALAALEHGHAEFRQEDADKLRCSLRRAYAEAEIRREFMGAFYACLAYDNTGDASYEKTAETRLASLRPLLDLFAEKYDSKEKPDPDAGHVFKFAVNTVDSMSKLQAKLEHSRAYWSAADAGGTTDIRYSGKNDGAIDISLGSMVMTVDPGDCSILGIYEGQSNLLKAPVPLVIFRMGGLEESGRHLGRSFVKPRAMRLSDGGTEVTLSYGAHGMTLTFRTSPNLNAVLVKCHYGNLPCAGTLEFPWMVHLDQGKEIYEAGSSDVSAKMGIPHLSRPWSFKSGAKIILLSEVADTAQAQANPLGIRWNAFKEAEVACLLSIA